MAVGWRQGAVGILITRPMPIFTARITHRRFSLSPFSAEQMVSLGERMIERLTDRMTSATNTYDSPAKPLSPAYAKRKSGGLVPGRVHKIQAQYGRGLGRVPVRNMVFGDHTLRALKVKSASENHVTIGFTTAKANSIISGLRKYESMWGVSPKDRLYSYQVLGDLTMQGSGQIRSSNAA